jgi:hypothetical protein
MKITYAVLGAVLILAGVYCSLWIMSSASLACTACNCEYSLLASTFRCRQPVIATILAAVSFGGAMAAFIARSRISCGESTETEQ